MKKHLHASRLGRPVKAALAFALAGTLLGAPTLAAADDLNDIRERLERVEREQQEAEQAKQDAEAKAGELGEHLEHTGKELAAASARLQETTAKVAEARAALATAEAELAEAEAEAERIESELAVARTKESQIEEAIAASEEAAEGSRATVSAIARESYKQGGMGSLASTLDLLGGEADAVEEMAMARTVLRVQDAQIRQLASQEAEQVAEQDRLAGVRQDIAYLLALAEANVVAKEKARTAAAAAKAELEALEAQQAEEKSDLGAEKAKAKKSLKAEETRSRNLEDELADLASTQHGLKVKESAELERIAEAEARGREAAAAERQRQVAAEERRSAAASRSQSAPAQPKRQPAPSRPKAAPATPKRAPAPPPQPSGTLSQPMPGPITSEFGMRMHPILGINLLHSGIDFAAPCGTPVTAAADGVVHSTPYDNSRGNYVVIDHGVLRGVNLTTLYLHLESFAVSSGTSISRGQVIGYEGTTGSSTGCHLHFETRENGTPVNPRNWL